MAEHIRIRCQVLKTIAAIGPCTIKEVREQLPHLEYKQIRKTCTRLYLQDDEIKVVGKRPNEKGGNPLNIYEVRGEDEHRSKTTDKRVGRKKPGYRDQLKQPMQYDQKKQRIIIRYRERKIELLKSFLDHVSDTRKDILIGIINDYEQSA